MEKCKNHPVNLASARCKRCHIPICNHCKIQVTDGVFCSNECIDQFRNFHQRVSNYTGMRSGFSIIGLIKSIAMAAVVLGFIYGVFYLWFGTGDPAEMWDHMYRQIKPL